MADIERRGPNTWRFTLYVGTDSDGKRRRERTTIRIEDERIVRSSRRLADYLEEAYLDWKRSVQSPGYARPQRMSVAALVTAWHDDYAMQHLGGYTRRNYGYLFQRYFLPAFGDRLVGEIQTMELVRFLTALASDSARADGSGPLAVNTRLNVYKAIKSVFDAAVRWKVIAQSPLDGVDRPNASKAERRSLRTRKHAYTRDETIALIDALEHEPDVWRMYFLGLVLGGFRRGELLALRWPDVRSDGLYIRAQISVDEDGAVVDAELKTESSEAFVTMPRWYMADLRAYRQTWIEQRQAAGTRWEGDGLEYVFCSRYGKPFYPSTPTLTWRKIVTRHGLPAIRLHDLRHTTAMVLRESGADLKSIQERLRHARLSTTSDLYAHESPLVNRQTADRLEDLQPRPDRPGRIGPRWG